MSTDTPKPKPKPKPKRQKLQDNNPPPEVAPDVNAETTHTSAEDSAPQTEDSVATPTMTEVTMSTEVETLSSTETSASTPDARPLYPWEAANLSAAERLQLLIEAKAENTGRIAELAQKLTLAETVVADTKAALAGAAIQRHAVDTGLLEFNIGTAPRASGSRGPRVPAPTKDAILSYFEALGSHATLDGLAAHFGCAESTMRSTLNGMVAYGDIVTAKASELRAQGVELDATIAARTVFYSRA